MPKDVTVPALKAFTYRGRDVARGDLVTMAPVDAYIASRKGHVSLTRTYQTKVVTAEGEAPKRRRYRRRDMEAERG